MFFVTPTLFLYPLSRLKSSNIKTLAELNIIFFKKKKSYHARKKHKNKNRSMASNFIKGIERRLKVVSVEKIFPISTIFIANPDDVNEQD